SGRAGERGRLPPRRRLLRVDQLHLTAARRHRRGLEDHSELPGCRWRRPPRTGEVTTPPSIGTSTLGSFPAFLGGVIQHPGGGMANIELLATIVLYVWGGAFAMAAVCLVLLAIGGMIGAIFKPSRPAVTPAPAVEVYVPTKGEVLFWRVLCLLIRAPSSLSL